MTNVESIPFLISFCAAAAGAGAFYVQHVRLRLEGAIVTISSIRRDGDLIAFSVMNIGARPAKDIELSGSALKPGCYLEGLKAGGEAVMRLEDAEIGAELMLAFTDAYSRRHAETRSVDRDGAGLRIGRPVKVRSPTPTGVTTLPLDR